MKYNDISHFYTTLAQFIIYLNPSLVDSSLLRVMIRYCWRCLKARAMRPVLVTALFAVALLRLVVTTQATKIMFTHESTIIIVKTQVTKVLNY